MVIEQQTICGAPVAMDVTGCFAVVGISMCFDRPGYRLELPPGAKYGIVQRSFDVTGKLVTEWMELPKPAEGKTE